MSEWKSPSVRWVLAATIFEIDFITIWIPLGALFLGYIVIARPRWFMKWVLDVYGNRSTSNEGGV